MKVMFADLPLLEIMMVKYSPVMLEKNPRRKPLGLVVVNPTRMFSAIVDRHEPMKSYLMMELGRMFTPISVTVHRFVLIYYQYQFLNNYNGKQRSELCCALCRCVINRKAHCKANDLQGILPVSIHLQG